MNGANVAVYNYRMASYSDFNQPCPDDPSLQAYELRGLTFVQQDDGSWERWIMLPKWFNLGETIGWMLDDLRDKPIRGVWDKLDGSLIQFVRINGMWLAKTKQVFDNEQAEAANRILAENPRLHDFLDCCYENRYVPLFEYTSPSNQIVLRYPAEQLTLIQIRCASGGSFYPHSSLETALRWGLPIVQPFIETEPNLEAILAWAEVTTGVEGVVANVGGKLVKVKTEWYRQQHRAKDQLGRSDRFLLELVLSDGFDDAIAALDGMDEMKVELETKAHAIASHYNEHSYRVEALIRDYHIGGNEGSREWRKSFYQANASYPYIGVVMGCLDGRDCTEGLKQAIMKRYRTNDDVKELFQ